MRSKAIAGGVCFVAFLALTGVWAQQKPKPFPAPAQPKTSTPTETKSQGRQSAQPSCAEEAGIPKSLIQQHQSIMRSAQQQVVSVCADVSLTEQQQREEIRKIRQNAQKEADGLLTPQQLEELKACQRARARSAPNVPHPSPVAHNNGPCAGIR